MTASTGENEELLLIAGWNINWQSHYGKQNGDTFGKLKIDQPCDPTISPLVIQTKEMKLGFY